MSSSVRMNVIDGATTTIDATPTTIIAIPATDPNVSFRIGCTVIARRQGNSDVSSWNQTFLIDKTQGGTPSNVGILSIVAPIGTLGASAWTLATVFQENNIFIQVVGQVGANINWFATASPVAVMGD